jgi:hypothetical protein
VDTMIPLTIDEEEDWDEDDSEDEEWEEEDEE